MAMEISYDDLPSVNDMKDQGTRASFETVETFKGVKTATKRAHVDYLCTDDEQVGSLASETFKNSQHISPFLSQLTRVAGSNSDSVMEHLVSDQRVNEESYMLKSLTTLLEAQHCYARRLSHHGGADYADPLCAEAEARLMKEMPFSHNIDARSATNKN
jgi:hypothetical protein